MGSRKKADKDFMLGSVTRDISEGKRAKQELQEAYDNLEIRVKERTAELARANEALQTEIAERKRAEQQTERHTRHLAGLRSINMAITATLDVRFSANVIVDQVVANLGVDAVALLLFNRRTQTLEFAAGRGFRTDAIARSRLRLSEGLAGHSVLQRRIVSIASLPETMDKSRRALLLAEEGFAVYYGAPLIAKGQLKGVLEIYHRAPLDTDPEWLDVLETFTTQAAIAIDNAELFEDLQRSNGDLALACNSTIEGWSRALDLREQQTVGHSQRVTEMSLRLARYLGVNDTELMHMRRGALLHDIGKMAISDSILLKPGPLSPEERAIMRQHPVRAYELLIQVTYLQPALDIPRYHHEKWDGTGYPYGLKGPAIPLAARIFAVADVWDALQSDRPYRAAWPHKKALQYIALQSAQHFNPRVVEAFLSLELAGDLRVDRPHPAPRRIRQSLPEVGLVTA